MRKKNVTITDIAEKTGYSKTTVSFAFNWPNRISSEAVEKIMKCANELGYKGTSDILQDSANRYKTICVLLPEADTTSVPPWAKPMLCLYQQCASHGIMFSLIDSRRSSDMFFAKYSAVDAFMFLDKNVDPMFLEVAKKRKIPVIGINLEVEGENEEEKIRKRNANSVRCIEMIFNIINFGSEGYSPSNNSYTFFEKNN